MKAVRGIEGHKRCLRAVMENAEDETANVANPLPVRRVGDRVRHTHLNVVGIVVSIRPSGALWVTTVSSPNGTLWLVDNVESAPEVVIVPESPAPALKSYHDMFKPLSPEEFAAELAIDRGPEIRKSLARGMAEAYVYGNPTMPMRPLEEIAAEFEVQLNKQAALEAKQHAPRLVTDRRRRRSKVSC